MLLFVLGADLVADMASFALKAAIGVDRPPVRYAQPKPLVPVPQDHSFPSGHAATSFACATVLASYAPRRGWLFFVLAAAIAFSRVYVGVHYPVDVLGGALLGALVAIALQRGVAGLRRSLPAPRAG